MIAVDLIKAFIIGMCVSVPLGPVSISALRNSLARGRWSGFVTGLGATTVDTAWATVSIFALGYAQSLFDAHQSLILLAGGVILAVMGVSIALSNPFRRKGSPESRESRHTDDSVSPADYAKSVAMGISNPGAIFIMFAMMAAFKISVDSGDFPSVLALLACLACGSVFYWFCFSWIFSTLKKAINIKAILLVSRISGIAIAVFGCVFLVRGILMIFN